MAPADLWLTGGHPLTEEIKSILKFNVLEELNQAKKGSDPESLQKRMKYSRERIGRIREAEKARKSLETRAIMTRYYRHPFIIYWLMISIKGNLIGKVSINSTLDLCLSPIS